MYFRKPRRVVWNSVPRNVIVVTKSSISRSHCFIPRCTDWSRQIVKNQNWPVPTNVDETCSFVSFAGYYINLLKTFLTHVTTSAKLDATGHRWLAAYDITIRYKCGKSNGDADALSRYKEISDSSIKAINHAMSIPYVSTICMTQAVVLEYDKDEGDLVMSHRMWRNRQRDYPTTVQFVTAVTRKWSLI